MIPEGRIVAAKRRVLGALVKVTHFVEGYPLGLGTDTMCKVDAWQSAKGTHRVLLVRDDGRQGSWWVDRASCVRLDGLPL